MDDAPPPFIDAQIRGIVGIEITIHDMRGKWKVSQNRSEADRAGVISGLTQKGDAEALAMADLVKTALESKA